MASSDSTLHGVCHRIGGGEASNLALKPHEASLSPPGISVLLGGTPQQAAAEWRAVFPKPGPSAKAQIVGTADIDRIRELGFNIVPMPTPNFPNHGRLIHASESEAGFSEANLQNLSEAFTDSVGL